MGVGVHDSGNDGGTVEIDYECGWTSKNPCLGIGPDELNATGPNGESGRLGSRVVDRVYPSVGENEIRGSLRFERCWCEHGSRKVG